MAHVREGEGEESSLPTSDASWPAHFEEGRCNPIVHYSPASLWKVFWWVGAGCLGTEMHLARYLLLVAYVNTACHCVEVESCRGLVSVGRSVDHDTTLSFSPIPFHPMGLKWFVNHMLSG